MSLPKFPSKYFFAPMAGVSDPALRLICNELGAGLVVTEFFNIHAIISQKDKITNFIEFSEKEFPRSCQIFGSELDVLERAIKIIEPYFDIIDYNMGCPAPHITKNMACSALLREPELTDKIFKVLKKSKKPVSIKIRAGVSQPDKYQKIIELANKHKIDMVTMHARTVKQGYSGEADWELIKDLKRRANMPIVGNGDIDTPEIAIKRIKETGCDYVMIGRAAARNPFLFKMIIDYEKTGKYKEISDKRKLEYFLKYLEYTQDYPTIKFANKKMQAMNFTKGIIGGKNIRQELMKIKCEKELKKLIQNKINLLS